MAVAWSLSSLIIRTHVPFYVLLHGGHVCVNVWDVYLVCVRLEAGAEGMHDLGQSP